MLLLDVNLLDEPAVPDTVPLTFPVGFQQKYLHKHFRIDYL